MDVRRRPSSVALTVVKTVVRRPSADVPTMAMMSSVNIDSGPCSPVAPTRFHEEAMSLQGPCPPTERPGLLSRQVVKWPPADLLPTPAIVRDPKALPIVVALTGPT